MNSETSTFAKERVYLTQHTDEQDIQLSWEWEKNTKKPTHIQNFPLMFYDNVNR